MGMLHATHVWWFWRWSMLDYRGSQWPPLVLSMPPFWIYIPCFYGKSVSQTQFSQHQPCHDSWSRRINHDSLIYIIMAPVSDNFGCLHYVVVNFHHQAPWVYNPLCTPEKIQNIDVFFKTPFYRFNVNLGWLYTELPPKHHRFSS